MRIALTDLGGSYSDTDSFARHAWITVVLAGLGERSSVYVY